MNFSRTPRTKILYGSCERRVSEPNLTLGGVYGLSDLLSYSQRINSMEQSGTAPDLVKFHDYKLCCYATCSRVNYHELERILDTPRSQ